MQFTLSWLFSVQLFCVTSEWIKRLALFITLHCVRGGVTDLTLLLRVVAKPTPYNNEKIAIIVVV